MKLIGSWDHDLKVDNAKDCWEMNVFWLCKQHSYPSRLLNFNLVDNL